MAWTRISSICALWPWPLRYDLGSRSWPTLGSCQGHDTPLGHGQQLCEILSRSNLAMRSYGPDTDFQYVCTVTLTLESWPWEGHDTPLGHGQQLCEILHVFRSNFAVRNYGPDKDFQYVCTLTLEIWPWVKVMTHPWVMDNNYVKLYPDWTREYEVMATDTMWTDRQTDRVIPIYPP